MNLLLDGIENALNVEIHHLGEHLLGVGIELLAPSGTGISEENIDVISRLRDFSNQAIEVLHARAICGHGDGLSARPLVGKSIQGCDGFIAGSLLAGCDVDF